MTARLWMISILLFQLFFSSDGSRKRKHPMSETIIPKFDVYTMDALAAHPLPNDRPKPMMIDCIQYSNDPITIYRMVYLKDVIDLFILMEVKGHDNQYRMDADNSPFLKTLEKENKLLKMRLDEFPYEFKYRQNTTKSDASLFRMTPIHFRDTKVKHAGLLTLAKEKFLVDSFFHEFKNKFANKTYLLLFGESTEIPRKEILQKAATLYGHPVLHTGLRLEMSTFYYNFRWIVPEERVRRSILIADTRINEISSLIDLRWYEGEKLPVLFRAGWHCQFFLSPGEIKQHIRDHLPEYNLPAVMNGTWIDYCKQNGLDIFRRKFIYITKYDGSEGYPVCKPCYKEVPYAPHFRVGF